MNRTISPVLVHKVSKSSSHLSPDPSLWTPVVNPLERINWVSNQHKSKTMSEYKVVSATIKTSDSLEQSLTEPTNSNENPTELLNGIQVGSNLGIV